MARALAKSQKLQAEDLKRYYLLQTMRVGIACFATSFLAQSVELGVSLSWLLFAATFGTIFAGSLLKNGRSMFRTLIQHFAVFAVLFLLFKFLNIVFTGGGGNGAELSNNDFLIPRIADDVWLIIGFYGVSFLSTWFFWTSRQAVTLEIVSYSALFVWLLSGHRNYHIDAPRQISSLSWKLALFQRLQVEPQHLFLGLGVIFIVLLSTYLVLANNRVLFGDVLSRKSYGPSQKFLAISCPLVLLLALYFFATILNQNYEVDLGRASNGVGQSDQNQEGQSNLGFHPSISPTKQPAALVRLEGDYATNPWQPMLYLREGALSKFSGKEIVGAGIAYDSDIAGIAPGQRYLSSNADPGPNRTRITQSVYLLSDHTAPFTIGTPRRITPIKNPYPERFRMAYQALSYAPVRKPSELIGKPLGDKNWSEEMWRHYLKAPGSTWNERGIIPFIDKKIILGLSSGLVSELSTAVIKSYQQLQDELSLAQGLTDAHKSQKPLLDEYGEDLRYLSFSRYLSSFDVDEPIQRAAMISEFLSTNSIYTLKPEHKITERGDPVAPYLFGEKMRGYCVHFSHAAVYLMRLAGIPARIGTGYLTDLSYAKDGHILLHLGDRHAWPEVYVEDQGWVVLDITPAQAEGEEPLVPDENLLDDLMNKLDPVEELLDPVPVDINPEKKESFFGDILTPQSARGTVIFIVLALLLFKLWLRHSYRFSRNSKMRAIRAYRSFASLMADLGKSREHGETHWEFANRLKSSTGIDASAITRIYELLVYGGESKSISTAEVDSALQKAYASFNSTSNSRVKRIFAFFSPLSSSRLGSW